VAGRAHLRRRHAFRIAALVAVTILMTYAAAASAAEPAFHDAGGLHVLAQRSVDRRLLSLRVSTAALAGPANVRILLPPGYSDASRTRYPVFYLLHGTSGGASDWTLKGDAERVIGGRRVIVVMPDIALNDDGGGWCTDWWNGGRRGTPMWETFHIEQLIPWVDSNLRTIRKRRGRAIAGLSQGGFCSMSYAARHPGLFAIALAYSGAPDIAYSPDVVAGSTAIINATEVGLDHVPPNSMFGDRATQEVNWAAHDPATLAENLRHTRLFMYTGNGQPGPLDSGPPNAGAMSIEGAVWRDNHDFHDRLVSLHIPSFFDDYGPGTHSWPYWTRDLRWSIGPIMSAFAHPPPRPSRVTYTSAEDRYSIYGWQVTMHRRAREFSTLERAGTNGFTLAGSGSASVVTPASYRPGQTYLVKLSGQRITRTLVLGAPPGGRLRIEVPLGPSNPYQEYTPQAEAAGTRVYRTDVTIAPMIPTN
jgi:S-formylglutathione hydrolase FrmB